MPSGTRSRKSITGAFSCGITDSAEFKTETISIDAMIELADARLYQAKQEGRNRIVVS